ncbi:hypothetical protein [Mycetohabitans rhizoxinica]|uniref:hypothetical protein n=1 Tax=Mycetohabitans rhizoxinica TaxID=412963 RepID=UPI0030CC4502
MKDLHPMLVLSPKPFNERTGMVIRLAMTTADFNDTNPFATKAHPWKRVSDDVFASACEQLNRLLRWAISRRLAGELPAVLDFTSLARVFPSKF